METVPVKARVHLNISGRVQGVYFRASTVQQARLLRLTGWVMNCRDGSVQVLAEGPAEKLEELIGWCRQGPAGARVEKVDLQREDFRAEFADFRIKESPD